MALEKFDELKRGDTWNPTIYLYSDLKKTVPYDATDMTLKCHIKERMEETAPDIFVLTGTWTDQSNGVGNVNLTHVQSLQLRIMDYYVQFKIYTTLDNTVVKTPKQGILPVVEVLEKDIA
jgi:hypothetical protein